MPLKIENYYDHIKDGDKIDRSYPNEKELQIKLPFRMMICGPSGSGKTNILINLIKMVGIFDQIILLAKDLEEPLYKHLIKTYAKIEKKHKVRMLLAINDIKDLPSVDDCDEKLNILLICDDLICESKKDLALVESFWIRARKRGVSSVFLSQGYYCIPKKIRQNSNYILIKKLDTIKDLKAILKECSLGVDLNQVMALYKQALGTGDPHTAFFMIDSGGDESLRFRSGFTPMQ
jgi:Ni2+-binding GTPase involved in maturation of urease and hydrogenase